MAKVLIVEDSSGYRTMVEAILKKNKFDTLTAESGNSALKVLNTLNSNELPNIVISDIRMPNGDGLFLIKSMSADPKLKKIPLLMLSAESDKSTIVNIIKAGRVMGYLFKPFEGPKLIQKIDEILEKAAKEDAVNK